jgi:NTP pyrophosphatase (non-canonical NTP hydrolase)
MGDNKEAALKPLEEAAETFGAWQVLEPFISAPALNPSYNPEQLWPKEVETKKERLADEVADCIQACVNIADRYGLDLADAMERCEKRNRERGRCE